MACMGMGWSQSLASFRYLLPAVSHKVEGARYRCVHGGARVCWSGGEAPGPSVGE